MSINQHCSSEWKAIVAAGRKKLNVSQATLAMKLGISTAYAGFFETKGMVPTRLIVEKAAELFGVPVEDALIAAGYSNQNVARGYRRYLDAIKNNTPMRDDVGVKGQAPTKSLKGSDLLNAFSQLINEHESLKSSNEAMSSKLNKILEAVK